MKRGDKVWTIYGKIETVSGVMENGNIVTQESLPKLESYKPRIVFPMGSEVEMPDGAKATRHCLDNELVYWQGPGNYTIVHNQVFWGYVQMDDAWVEDEPETEYRILLEEDLEQ